MPTLGTADSLLPDPQQQVQVGKNPRPQRSPRSLSTPGMPSTHVAQNQVPLGHPACTPQCRHTSAPAASDLGHSSTWECPGSRHVCCSLKGCTMLRVSRARSLEAGEADLGSSVRLLLCFCLFFCIRELDRSPGWEGRTAQNASPGSDRNPRLRGSPLTPRWCFEHSSGLCPQGLRERTFIGQSHSRQQQVAPSLNLHILGSSFQDTTGS